MAHVVDTTYGRNRDLGQVTDPQLLTYYASLGYTIDGTVSAAPAGAPAQIVLGVTPPYGATDGEVVTVAGGAFVTAPQTGGVGGGGGAVASVNGHTGTVVLSASDVGAEPAGTAASAVAAVVNAAPGALDTLKELADALGDDANYAATITTALAGKASTAQLGNYATGSALTAETNRATAAEALLAPIASLGNAATKNVGTTTGTVAAGDDTRLAVNSGTLLLGSTNGVLKKPWGPQSFIGPELWSATYFDTTTVNSIAGNTSTSPTLTGNGTSQKKMSRFRTGYTNVDGQVQETYRFAFTFTNTAPSGWVTVAIRGLTSTGTTVAGTEVYLWGSGDGQVTNYRSAIDFTIPALSASGVRYIEVELGMANNVPSGTATLSNVSFRQVAAARPSLNVSWLGNYPGNGSGDGLNVDVPVVDPVTGATSWVRKSFGPDGALKVSPQTMTAGQKYSQNYTTPSTTSQTGTNTNPTMTGTSRSLHIGNIGQIMGVVKADNSTELRCNTHGGEWARTTSTITDGATTSGSNQLTSATANFTLATHGGATVTGPGIPQGTYISGVTNSTTATMSANATATATGVTVNIGSYVTNFVAELDFGDGTWVALADTGKTHACRRVRITTHTQVTRSDQTTPFANVDNTFTVFDDGAVRFDRTVTFLATQQMYQWFYFMHSFDTTVLEQGRMGFGQQVLTGFDPRQYLATPAAATVTQGSSGTYGALTRTYYVTAISPQGETLPSLAVTSTTASGTTNSFTVNLPSTATGQTGWGIYDTTGLLAKVPVSVTTWTDANPTFGTAKAPTVNTATVLPGTQQYSRLMSDRADWAAFYDGDSSGIVFGTVTDRDNALSYPGATSLTCELDSHPGVLKNYWQLQDANGYQPVSTAALEGSYTQTIPSGTVLATTAYSFTYAPLDRTNWHREIQARGQGPKQFATVYPAS